METANKYSCFLWGPRQTGKSTLLKFLFPNALTYDLLQSDQYRRLLQNPELLRQELEAHGLTGNNQREPVIIDEVQKVPDLLDEVHWLIENRGLRFILCGSSARKVKRERANLLGGRAIRYELLPLVSKEITDFSLVRALNHGTLPPHYTQKNPRRLLQAYIGEYLREEIAAEAVTRNVPAFGKFLEVAGLSNGGIVNYSNIARECGVSSPTVRSYFQILEDTLIGSFVPAFNKRGRRRIIEAHKFYFFDVGIVSALVRRGPVTPGSELFGRCLEHFVYMELKAHSLYSGLFYPINYWRTASGQEVDFILNDGEVSVEVKATENAQTHHLRGLRAFAEEHRPRQSLLVSLDPHPRKTAAGIRILPVHHFLHELWENRIIAD
ncbi:MAG: ATP-binding protein [Spirochaetales bacterium]|nr:ATP-binding protein [Spirochaetales bacterium]